MSHSLLSFTNLSCERDQRVLFQELSLELLSGEALELSGHNGSGKTTLLRCLAGLSIEFSGQIDIDNFLYLGHASGISGLLSVRENQRWYAALTGALVEDVALDDALTRVGLAGYQDIHCAQLSAGEKRRVTLSRLLFSQAVLWLLDEPLTALDTQGVELVSTLIEDHCASGGAAIYATHQPLKLSSCRYLNLSNQDLSSSAK